MFKPFFRRLGLVFDEFVISERGFDFFHMGGDNQLGNQAAKTAEGVTVIKESGKGLKLHAANHKAQLQYFEEYWRLVDAKKSEQA